MPENARLTRTDRLALWGPAIAVLALHVAFATTFGIFRDELYYLSCARRLAWGYVDHPPFIALITAVWTRLFGDSLAVIRLLPALTSAATVAVAGSIARRFGGGRFAVVLAGFAVGLAPTVLGLSSVLSMNVFELLFWALAFRIAVELLDGGDERLWLLFGAVVGVGLLNKVSMLLPAFGLVVGLLVTRRWEAFRSRYLWLGGGLALLIFTPHLLWQRANGWPTLEFMHNASTTKNVALTPFAFLKQQWLQTGPFDALIWISGLVALLVLANLRPWRALGWAYLAILAVMLSTAAKPYYLSPVYPVLWAAGAVAIERITLARRGGSAIRAVVVTLVILTGLLFAPLARPMLPVEPYIRYSRALGVKPGTDERKSVGRLPQFYADMQEWRGLAEAVGRAGALLSPAERATTCVFAQNYGEAGAVEYFGRELGLPRPISAHNNWFLWGPGDCPGSVMLVIGDDRETLSRLFEEVEPGATFDCRDCMPYEDGLSIWIVRRPRGQLADVWPKIKNFS
ncbi:MAG: glycosyltransferase family 39 protein [Thermoanaerobaculia bacterium]